MFAERQALTGQFLSSDKLLLGNTVKGERRKCVGQSWYINWNAGAQFL